MGSDEDDPVLLAGARRAAPGRRRAGPGRPGRRRALGEPGVSALHADPAAAARRAEVVHPGGRQAAGPGGAARSASCRRPSPPTNTRPRPWPGPSRRSPGIKVKHDLIQEGDVVEKLQTSMQSGRSIYDGWISDSDLIGTHYRYGAILPLSDYMAGPGKEFTNPGLDLPDFIGAALHHRPRRQAVPAARPAVRQPLLVPGRLVRPQGPAGALPQEIRLRPGGAAQLVGLRGHRRLLQQRGQGARRPQGLRPHGLRQEGSLAGLALHRRLAVDGRHGRPGDPQRPAGRRVGHPGGRRPLHAGGRFGRAGRRRQQPGRRVRPREIRRAG